MSVSVPPHLTQPKQPGNEQQEKSEFKDKTDRELDMMMRVVNQQLQAAGDGSAWSGEHASKMTAAEAAAAAAAALRAERERHIERGATQQQQQQLQQHQQHQRRRQKGQQAGTSRKEQSRRLLRRRAQLEEQRRVRASCNATELTQSATKLTRFIQLDISRRGQAQRLARNPLWS